MRILVVEDEPLIRLTVHAVLEDLGHEVVEADSGESALALLQADPAIDLLFSDVRMPGMSGIELAAAARALRPDLPVALTSGYTEDDPGPYPVLRKPWLSEELVRLVHRMQGPKPGHHRLGSCA